MEAAAVHRSGQDRKQLLGVEAALARQSENLAEKLHTGRAHGISDKFDEIGGGGVTPHSEDFLTERIDLQVRADATNLTNTPLWDVPTAVRTSGSFGSFTGPVESTGSRKIQLGAKINF